MLKEPKFNLLDSLQNNIKTPLTLKNIMPHAIHGKSYPLGVTLFKEGANFCIHSKNASGIDLLFFDSAEDSQPARTMSLDPKVNRTFHYWHTFVPGVKAGQIYAYRISGPYQPEKGLRFDNEKVLLDPYGHSLIVPKNYSRRAASKPGDNTASAMKNIIVNFDEYDWENDEPLNIPFTETVIYEMHVRGFTHHSSSGVTAEKRGTYAGVIEKIPYLKSLGITAVELMPVFQYDMQDAPQGLTNYWGYSPVSFFAPHSGYSSQNEPMSVINEFRDMVKALHRAGIEVILDVVYNHTSENDEHGPTFSFRGIGNRTYYILEKDQAKYANYSGTGNTLNSNHPIVRRLILDSLHYWVEKMHVDGFRFDLASILSRGEHGEPLANPPILWDIETDPIFASTKLIAEAWDIGLYQVGSFVGDRWKEWNGRFRDDVRSFIRGDEDSVPKLPKRILASPDLFLHEEREPEQSINFITSHDGFTLNDLVSYNRKHNEANNEGNRDGMDDNISWNCGAEGPSDNPEIEALRKQQIKNFLMINLLSLGVPMLLMGDEARRTQLGNNNAYCQDNEISWFDWSFLVKHADIYRFTKMLIQFRKYLDFLSADRDLSLSQLLELAKIRWHGVQLNRPNWERSSHNLAFSVLNGDAIFYFILNASNKSLLFKLEEIPSHFNGTWLRVIDTSLESPNDFHPIAEAPIHDDLYYKAQAHSIVLLIAERTLIQKSK